LALHVTPADADDRAQVGRRAQAVQAAAGDTIDLTYVDQGYTGEKPAEAAREHGIELELVKLPEAKRGFVLLPRRWVLAGDLLVLSNSPLSPPLGVPSSCAKQRTDRGHSDAPKSAGPS
jgi:hypothetical protein